MKKIKDVSGLIRVLKDENISFKQRHVAEALGDTSSELAVEPLIQALKDEDSRVRSSAASALGLIGDNRAVEPLIGALKDEDSSIREIVSYSLGRIEDNRAVEPLI